MKCAGQWLHLGLSVDALTGVVLTIDARASEDAQALKAWIEPIAQSVGAEVLVTDDADGENPVADQAGLLHPVCKSHVKRNTQALLDEFRPLVAADRDGSLEAMSMTAAQALGDLERLGELINSRKPEQGAELEQLQRRYLHAAAPHKGATASLAYRLRLLFLDRWNLWSRLTRSRKWRGPNQEQLDGTNKACERAIGWWIKERYRSMRGDIGPSECTTCEPPAGLVWQLPYSPGRRSGTTASVSKRGAGEDMTFLIHSFLHQFTNDHH